MCDVVTLTNGLKMEGSLARALARYLLESEFAELRVRVPYGLASQPPSSDDAALFFPFAVFTARSHTINTGKYCHTCTGTCPVTGHRADEWSAGHGLTVPIDAHCYHMKHALPDRVKPSFVIFDIRALWRSALSVRVPGCRKLQMTA